MRRLILGALATAAALAHRGLTLFLLGARARSTLFLATDARTAGCTRTFCRGVTGRMRRLTLSALATATALAHRGFTLLFLGARARSTLFPATDARTAGCTRAFSGGSSG